MLLNDRKQKKKKTKGGSNCRYGCGFQLVAGKDYHDLPVECCYEDGGHFVLWFKIRCFFLIHDL